MMVHLECELGDVVRGPEETSLSFFFGREREVGGGGGGGELDLHEHWRPK